MTEENTENAVFLKDIFPFNLLDKDTLLKISPLFERVNFPSESLIFIEKEPADALYFILSGKVQIAYQKNRNAHILGCLSVGDHFGEDAIGQRQSYRTTAKCETRVVALRLSRWDIQRLQNIVPYLRDAFTLLSRSYGISRSVSFSWRNEKEASLLISRKHPFFLFVRIFLVGGLSLAGSALLFYFSNKFYNISDLFLISSIILLGLGAILTLWAALEWSNDYFIITHERVLVQKQLIGFYDSRQESPINAILSTGINRSVWGRSIGFGTVTIRSYTGDLKFERLPYTDYIYEILENQRKHVNKEVRRTEKDGMRETLKLKLEDGMHPQNVPFSREADKSKSRVYQSHSFSDWLARFFVLRYEKEGSVVYRTHWWILFRKTFMPSLFILLTVLAAAARVIGFFEKIPESAAYVAALFLMLAGWGWWYYRYQDWYNDIYIISGDQLIDVSRKPLGSEERRSAPLKNIQTVEYSRKGLVSLILNYGTVHIQIGNEELSFDNVYYPSQVQGEIYQKFREYTESVKRNEQLHMADWIRTYDELRQEKGDTDSSLNGNENG